MVGFPEVVAACSLADDKKCARLQQMLIQNVPRVALLLLPLLVEAWLKLVRRTSLLG
jgi:hypothetical protein